MIFAVLVAAPLAAATADAGAEDIAAFYQSHTVTIGSPNSPGGGYDIYLRVLARHIGRYIPGHPNVIVQNVAAAGGMALANQIYNTVPKDGSYFGMVRGTAIQEQVYKSPQAQFDGRKFAWIGNMNSDRDACIVAAGSGVRTIDDFYEREVTAGASGVGAQSYSFPVVYRELLGMKFKVISGYPGTPERMLALERGEITGACGISLSLFQSQFGRLAAEGKVRLVAQGALRADQRYAGVPNILDQAKTPDVRDALEFPICRWRSAGRSRRRREPRRSGWLCCATRCGRPWPMRISWPRPRSSISTSSPWAPTKPPPPSSACSRRRRRRWRGSRPRLRSSVAVMDFARRLV